MRYLHARLVLSILVFALFATGGCRVNHPWREAWGDLPWSGPGEQVQAESRTVTYFMIAAGTIEHRWVDPAGRTYQPEKVASAASAYLNDSGALRQWPTTRFASQPDHEVSMAPYRFSIVAVRPTVVVMRPLEPSRSDTRPRRHDDPGPMKGAWAIGVPHLANGFEYIAHFPYQPELWWFSPDLNQPPAKLVGEGEKSAEIRLPDGYLRLEAIDDKWQATRR